MPFLPRLGEHLLGAPLRLPSVPTWWCGDEDSRAHVLAHLERLDGQADVAPSPDRRRSAAGSWASAERDRAATPRSRRARTQWVGQEPLALASAPTLTPAGLEARRSVLRAFAVARNDSYVGDARAA